MIWLDFVEIFWNSINYSVYFLKNRFFLFQYLKTPYYWVWKWDCFWFSFIFCSDFLFTTFLVVLNFCKCLQTDWTFFVQKSQCSVFYRWVSSNLKSLHISSETLNNSLWRIYFMCSIKCWEEFQNFHVIKSTNFLTSLWKKKISCLFPFLFKWSVLGQRNFFESIDRFWGIFYFPTPSESLIKDECWICFICRRIYWWWI